MTKKNLNVTNKNLNAIKRKLDATIMNMHTTNMNPDTTRKTPNATDIETKLVGLKARWGNFGNRANWGAKVQTEMRHSVEEVEM